MFPFLLPAHFHFTDNTDKVKNSADGIYTYPVDPSIELYMHLNVHVSTGKHHLRLLAA